MNVVAIEEGDIISRYIFVCYLSFSHLGEHMQDLKMLSCRINNGQTSHFCIIKCTVNHFYKFTFMLSLDPKKAYKYFCPYLNHLLGNYTVKTYCLQIWKKKKSNHSRQAEQEMIIDSFLAASPTISYSVRRLSHGRLKQKHAQGV